MAGTHRSASSPTYRSCSMQTPPPPLRLRCHAASDSAAAGSDAAQARPWPWPWPRPRRRAREAKEGPRRRGLRARHRGIRHDTALVKLGLRFLSSSTRFPLCFSRAAALRGREDELARPDLVRANFPSQQAVYVACSLRCLLRRAASL